MRVERHGLEAFGDIRARDEQIWRAKHPFFFKISMSKVVLLESEAGEQIVIPSPADKLPPNPLLLGREPTSVAASSQRSSIASVDIPKEDKTLRNKLLKTDQRSFLTGVVSVDLQAAHILNTIRKAKF
ncbi:hypothetical protein K435DRAFT_865931 [Dendrothele bispora CBS 962.96]|uniref:Uncharacterized protein n=1 Tax=Dendrothele bispora (strain CBS 962.96) TaxID=1314807 RepID=A0A4S8LIQ5_DENBC|nr:hypothetical protein K435DRAFT_865931 [Dendrothele bispora CBS 962.96]